jgi:hypothetical protein
VMLSKSVSVKSKKSGGLQGYDCSALAFPVTQQVWLLATLQTDHFCFFSQ